MTSPNSAFGTFVEKLFVNFPVKLNLPKLNNFFNFLLLQDLVFNDHILDNFNILFLNNEKNKTVNKKNFIG